MFSSRFALLMGLALFVVGCGSSVEVPPPNTNKPKNKPIVTGPPLFEDVTSKTGITFRYRNGEEADHLAILESLGGGVGLIDYDGDGLLDIFFPGGGHYTGKDKKTIVGHSCKLFRNEGKFHFRDVTTETGIDKLAGGQPWFYTHGVAVADYDRDGDSDLLVTGWGRVALLRNESGKRFEDVTTEAGLDKGITWTTSAAWADLDRDGWPDLYLCQYADWSFSNHPTDCSYTNKKLDVCPPKRFSGLTDLLFLNKDGKSFRNVSKEAKLVAGGKESSKGLGVMVVDFNEDGTPEIFVCNDTVENFLYVNRSTPGKIDFEEKGMLSGVACDNRGTANGSMGVAVGDYERTGKPSLWVTNYENELHGLHGNVSSNGKVRFAYRTVISGIASIGQSYVGWGTAFVDCDLDGLEDLFISNGHAIRYPTGTSRAQKPVLLSNKGKGKFVTMTPRIGDYAKRGHQARGVGFGDLNNDGYIDVVVSHINEPVSILKGTPPKDRHWIGFQLKSQDNRDIVGARVVIEAGGQKQARFTQGGGSYLSSSDRRLVFGLGKTKAIDLITVYWPNGDKQTWKNLDVDSYHTLQQAKP